MTIPSGFGQTKAARSLSVAFASDQATGTAPLKATAPDRSTFTFAHSESDVNALAVDASDPNTLDPGGRAVRLTQAIGATTGAGAGVLFAIVGDGTSLVLRPWIYDDVRAKWFRVAIDVTVAAATVGPTTIASLGPGFVGAKFFLQILTNNGSVKNYYWFVR